MSWKLFGRIAFAIIPVVLGVLLLKSSIASKPEPQKKTEPEANVKVEITTVQAISLPRKLEGYGTVVAERRWSAIPQVSGKVTGVHPNLRTGGLVKAGETLFSIETVDQALEQDRIATDNRGLEAEIRQIRNRKAQLVKAKKSAQATLLLLQKEEQRYQNLYKAGAAAASTVDQRRREVLNQQRVIDDLESTIITLPHQIEALRARMASARVNIRKQSVQAGRARVVAPFDGRLGEVYLEAGQVVNAGSQLFTMEGSAKLRVEARFPTAQLSAFPLERAYVSLPDGQRFPATIGPLREQVDRASLTASLQLTVDAAPDPETPFLPGALVSVELLGEGYPEAPVVPRTAVRNGQVFIVEEGRLARRQVEVGFRSGERVGITKGLKPGETVITSDPGLAVDGAAVTVTGNLR